MASGSFLVVLHVQKKRGNKKRREREEGGGEKNQHDDHESHMTCKDSDRSLTSEHICVYIMYNTLYYKRVLTQGFAVSEYTLVCSTWT